MRPHNSKLVKGCVSEILRSFYIGKMSVSSLNVRTKEGKSFRANNDKDKSYCKSQVHYVLLRQ